jgi:basic membrane protein A
MSMGDMRLVLGLLAVLGACTALAGAAGAASHAEAAAPRVAVVLDLGGCPDAMTLRICEGFKQASRRTGVTGRIMTPTFKDALGDFLELIARQRYEAILTFGLYFTPAYASVAKRHPDVPFVVIDGSRRDVPGRPRNTQGVVFRTSEAAYLAGWLAGKLEQRRPGRDVVGVVGGLKVPAVDEFVFGFAAGARRAAPGIEVLTDYSNDWSDVSKCAAIARRQIARGAGTVFNVAGGCGLGTLEAARSAGVWGVGVDSDQSFLGPHILTSVLKNFDVGFLAVMRQVKARRIVTGRDTVLTMRDGAVGLGRISPKVPRALLSQLETLRRKIVAGEIRVPGALPPAPS